MAFESYSSVICRIFAFACSMEPEQYGHWSAISRNFFPSTCHLSHFTLDASCVLLRYGENASNPAGILLIRFPFPKALYIGPDAAMLVWLLPQPSIKLENAWISESSSGFL